MIRTTAEFNRVAQGPVRPLDWGLNISMTKERDTLKTWFTLDISRLNDTDLLSQTDGQEIQLWDYYQYENFSSRVIDINIERSIAFPYNIQSAIMDATLENHDGFLSIAGGPYSEYILPKRPVRAYLGFRGAGIVPQFVGLTQGIPKYNGIDSESLTWTADDFLSDIASKPLAASIAMEDAKTGEIIAEIFRQYGMEESMIDIDEGTNVIPFIFLDKGRNVGNILRDLVQSENGSLWLTETGTIKFISRRAALDAEPVMTFDRSNIIEIVPSQASDIVNHIVITGEIRRLFDNQKVYDWTNNYAIDWSQGQTPMDDPYYIAPNSTRVVWIDFDNPIIDMDTNLALDRTGGSGFTAVIPSGAAAVHRGVTAIVEPFGNTAKITFRNEYSTGIEPVGVRINTLQIFGRPAQVVDELNIDQMDEQSVEQFEDHKLEISNDYFGSRENAERYAAELLQKRSKYNPTVKIKAKGNPALQLGDLVEMDDRISGVFRVVGQRQSLNQRGLNTTITLERADIRRSFMLDVAQLDSPTWRLG